MATNHTTNYNLNLWEPTDNFVREEFNENTTKLDAALATKATTAALTSETNARTSADSALAARVTALENKSRFTKLWEMTLTSNATEIAVPCSGVNWTKWDKVHLDILSNNGADMGIYFNEYDASHRLVVINSSEPYFGPRYTLYPGFRADRYFECSYLGTRIRLKRPYSELNNIILSGATMSTGAKFILWGEK